MFGKNVRIKKINVKFTALVFFSIFKEILKN